MRSILALGAFFVLGAGLSSCGGGVPGNAVADVGGNPITTTAFNHWMFIAAKGQAARSPGAPIIVPTDPPEFKKCIAQVRKQIPTLAKTPDKQLKGDCKQLFTSLGSQVLGFLIRAYWYQADAAKEHVKVTDAEVQQAFARAKQQQFHSEAAFQSFLSQSGQTLQDILFRFRIDEILRKLVAKRSGSVSSAQIDAYYRTHLSQFGTPQTRNIRIVRTSSRAKALAAKNALASRQSWNAVAKKYSIDTATKSKGGLLVGVSKGQQDRALDQASFSAPLNKVLGPVHGSFGYYIFEVTKIKRPIQQTLAQATPLIRQILSGQAQSSGQAAVNAQAKKNWLHKTNCRAEYAMSDCNGYKAPKTATGPAPTPPAG